MTATVASTAPAAPRSEVFELRDVTKVYRMGEVDVRALDGVSLSIHSGELMVILGPSGSGKSTLLNILGGLDTPSSGVVCFREVRLDSAGTDELTRFRREHVGFVFQFYNLIPSLTARENVQLVTDIAVDPMTPEHALELVGLADRVNHFPSQLSGGEQQRVAVARAVARRPDVLLCDEPTGALDSTSGRLVLEVIDHVNREIGTTIALITHNVGIAAMADRVLRMGNGRIVSEERNEERASPSNLHW